MPVYCFSMEGLKCDTVDKNRHDNKGMPELYLVIMREAQRANFMELEGNPRHKYPGAAQSRRRYQSKKEPAGRQRGRSSHRQLLNTRSHTPPVDPSARPRPCRASCKRPACIYCFQCLESLDGIYSIPRFLSPSGPLSTSPPGLARPRDADREQQVRSRALRVHRCARHAPLLGAAVQQPLELLRRFARLLAVGNDATTRAEWRQGMLRRAPCCMAPLGKTTQEEESRKGAGGKEAPRTSRNTCNKWRGARPCKRRLGRSARRGGASRALGCFLLLRLA